MSFQLTPLALQDLQEIWSYIAEDNSAAADALEQDFYTAFRLLSHQPELGVTRPKWTGRAVKFWPVRKHYLVVYKPSSRPLQIIRILHAARDIPTLLKSG